MQPLRPHNQQNHLSVGESLNQVSPMLQSLPPGFNQNVAPFQPGMMPQRSQKLLHKSSLPESITQSVNADGFGLRQLESMGRVIQPDEKEGMKRTQNVMVFSQTTRPSLNFQPSQQARPKMASSVIFQSKNSQEFNRFPSFAQISKKPQKISGLGGLDALAGKARIVEEEEDIETSVPVKKFSLQSRQSLDMFKSSIQGQSQFKAQSPSPPINFNPNFAQNGPKKFEFQRNASSINKSLNFGSNKQIEPKTSPKAVEVHPANPIIPVPTINSNEVPSPSSAVMFKKKENPYTNSSKDGKTDEKLLKLLALNSKNAPKEVIVSEKEVKQSNSETRQPIKPYQATGDPFFQTFGSMGQKSSSEMPRKFTKSDFNIGKKMGKGQFGEVMLVQHKLTGFLCGMKVMEKKEIKSQKYDNQIARQLAIQFYLAHRNIAPLYGYFQDPQNIYLLIQFCTDGQLLQKLRKSRRMQESDVSPIIREICQGLNYIHKEEIIHRDIKPENILFNFGTVKISDFGWAVHSGNGMRKTISGSPLYYSPEIVMENSYDEKIDIWSIGMMTYQCLLGKIPFRVYSELDLNRIVSDQITFPEYVEVSDEAKDFILRIMKKKPEDRMEMREIMRHPFITKYMKERKVSGETLEEFRSLLRI